MKSAYLLASEGQDWESILGSWVWKLPSLPKVQLFIWKCMHLSINVKECLSDRGMALDTTCPRCHKESESITPALMDCTLVKPTWYQLGLGASDTLFFTQDTKDWIASNANRKTTHASNITFPFTIWLIWRQRN